MMVSVWIWIPPPRLVVLALLEEMLKREVLVEDWGRRCQARRTSAGREGEEKKGGSEFERKGRDASRGTRERALPCEAKMKKTATPIASILKSLAKAVKSLSVTIAQLRNGKKGEGGEGTRRDDQISLANRARTSRRKEDKIL